MFLRGGGLVLCLTADSQLSVQLETRKHEQLHVSSLIVRCAYTPCVFTFEVYLHAEQVNVFLYFGDQQTESINVVC